MILYQSRLKNIRLETLTINEGFMVSDNVQRLKA